MRVVIGLRSLHPGKVGGLETYVRMLLREWARLHPEDEWILLVNADAAHTFSSPGPWMRIETVHDGNDLDAWRAAAEHYAPAVYFSPMTVIDPPTVGLPTVVNIPDLQHLFLPQFYDAEVLRHRELHYALSARRAAAVLTLSDHAKKSIVEKLGVPEGKTHGILLAAGEEFRQPVAPERIAEFRKKHALPEIFGYFPANFWLHKNHAVLFSAMELYRRAHGAAPHIALSGFAGENQARVQALIRRHRLDGVVHILGYLPAVEIPIAYRAASFLVFPSLFEGFGIPVAEAMAAGCPVICSNATSLPEFAAEAALLFDPGDAQQLMARMHELLTQPGLRADLAERGLRRSEQLNWRRTAELSYEVLRSAAKPEPSPDLAVKPVTVRADGTIDAGMLPDPEKPAILFFQRPGSGVPESSRHAALTALRESGLAGLIGSVRPGDNAPPTLFPFDVIRLKSENYLPLESLWVGPSVCRSFIEWLRENPGVTEYEIALNLAMRGALGNCPAAQIQSPAIKPAPLPARTGARLSRTYYGVPDGKWLEAWGQEQLGRSPLAALLARRHRTRHWLIRRLAEVAYWRQTGRPPRVWAERLRALLRPAPPALPQVDGWIGRVGLVNCRRGTDNLLKLILDSPAWPYRQPPVVRVELNGRRIFNAPLSSRGPYHLEWPWPIEGDQITLRIRCNRSFIPSEHGLGEDGRTLSVRALAG